MTVFQVLIARGLKEHADEGDAMLASIQFPIAYAAVLAGKCLEEIDKVNKQVVNQDLMVSRSYFVCLIQSIDLLPA